MTRSALGAALLGAMGVVAGGCFWGGGDDSTPTPTATVTPATSATPNPSPTVPTLTATPTHVPGPEFLAVWVTGSYGSQEVMVFDLHTGEERHRWAVETNWPGPRLAGGHVYVAEGENRDQLARYELDGTGRTVLPTPPGLPIADVAASRDGTVLAVTAYLRFWEETGETAGVVLFFDMETGAELRRVLRAEAFPAFRGGPWNINWREDGSGVVIEGATHTDGPGGRVLVRLDGTVELYTGDGGVVSRDGLRLARTEGNVLGGLTGYRERLAFYDLEPWQQIRVIEAERELTGILPWTWSSDGTEVLLREGTFERDPIWGYETLVSTRWLLLELATGVVTRLPDIDTVRAWMGEDRVDYACEDEEPHSSPAWRRSQSDCWSSSTPFDLTILGVPVSGNDYRIEFLGLVPR